MHKYIDSCLREKVETYFGPEGAFKKIEKVQLRSIEKKDEHVLLGLSSGEEIVASQVIYADRWSLLSKIKNMPKRLPFSTEGKSKGVIRAEGLIEHLEAIRHGLLLGQISKKRLTDIVKALETQRDKNMDPGLVQIVNDIELRAKVELAKLEMMG